MGGEKPLRSVRQGSDRELLKASLAAVQVKEISGRAGKARTPPGSHHSVQAGGLESIDSGDISIPTFSSDLNPHIHTVPGGWSCSEPEFVARKKKIAGELLFILQNPLFLPSES